MNYIRFQIRWMIFRIKPEYFRLVRLIVCLSLFLMGAGAPTTGGGVGEHP
jgi:hypothetical protein